MNRQEHIDSELSLWQIAAALSLLSDEEFADLEAGKRGAK